MKALTLPLTKAQLESTTRIQKLTPLQQRIQAKYAKDEQTKSQLLAQLFQAAQVNPLAGCFPALVQIPVFLSLYRALTNLVAADKLNEGFLWVPSLEGPVFSAGPGKAAEWLTSAFSGNPTLGWHDTLCYLSLPLILFVSQTISQKVLTPPKDPNRKMTEQEQISQSLINNLPFIVAFFSINVPAGLAVYWIINNVLTTGVTLAVKSTIKDEPFPVEVDRIMALVDTPPGGKVSSNAQESLRKIDERPKAEGFGNSSGKKVTEKKSDGEEEEGEEDEDNMDDEDDENTSEDAASNSADSQKRSKRSVSNNKSAVKTKKRRN